jgi:hypothetical protein
LVKDKKEQDQSNPEESLPWIESSDNPWRIKLLDLRPVTQAMLSTSSNPQMASNAVSYGGEDGTIFWGQKPQIDRIIAVNLSIAIDGALAPGVLFMPETMEHKWAIYFDGENLIFVRSWLRQVFVVAKTVQVENQLVIKNISGEFLGNEEPAFTIAVLNFLLISHSIREIIPAPLPRELELNTRNAGLGHFPLLERWHILEPLMKISFQMQNGKLRSHSLLHIAVARGDVAEIERLIQHGMDVNALANDGLTPLHWAIAGEHIEPMQKLLALGAKPKWRIL